MPILPNTRQEAFCQHRFAGKTMDESYKLAGYKPSMQAASRLSRNVKIVARIKELQAKTAKRSEVTADTIADELNEAIAFAKKCNSPSALVAAITTKAKLYGLTIERAVVNVTHNYAMMNEEELRFEMAAINAEARSIKAGVQH